MMKNFITRILCFKRSISPLFILLIPFSIANAQISRSVSFLKKELQLNSIKVEQLGGEEFQKLHMGNLLLTGEPGKPELPVKYIRLIVPPDMSVANIDINSSGKESIKLLKKIYPSQFPIPAAVNYTKKVTKADSSIYNSDNPYPLKLVKIVDEGYFDGNHIITLAVYPIQYIPESNQIDFYSRIDFTLNFGAGKNKKEIKGIRLKKNQYLYDNILSAMVDNIEDIATYQVKPKTVDVRTELTKSSNHNFSIQSVASTVPFYEYVIITTNTLKPAFNDFISWKKRKGLNIGLVTIDQILSTSSGYTGDLISGIYDDAGKVRQYLCDAYNSGITVYALIVGDRYAMPIRWGCGSLNTWDESRPGDSGNKVPADLYFSDFDGDWEVDGDVFIGEFPFYGIDGDNPDYYPEIFVGRLLCQNTTEVTNWTKKVIQYEQYPFKGNYSAITKSLSSQSDEFQIGGEAQKVCSSATSPVFSTFTHKIIEELPSYDSYNPTYPTGHDIINEINQGYGFYNIYHHGIPWVNLVRCAGEHDMDATYDFTKFGIAGLDNDDIRWPLYTRESGNGFDNIAEQNSSTIIYSCACNNAQFENQSDEFRSLADVFTTLNASGGPAFLGNTRNGFVGSSYIVHQEFIKAIFNSNLYNLGVAEAISKANNSPSNCKHFLAYSHNLFGDPEMPVWTAIPSQFSNINVTDANNSITVTAGLSGCTITACSMDNGVTYYASVDGNNITFYTSVRPLYITITKQNYIPYTAIVGGTLTSNTSISGKYNVLSTISVNPGVTLTVAPGTNIRFTNNSYLIVNGTLIANGTQSEMNIFDFVNSSTNGNCIRFNPGSGGSVSYSKIKNAYAGIYAANASPDIISNTFIFDSPSRGQYAIYALDYCNSWIINNTISGAGNYGIRLNTNSCPNMDSPGDAFGTNGYGCNVITNNSQGMNCTWWSNPYIGLLNGGNSIYNNASMNLRCSYNCQIYAYNTYWGNPFDASKIFFYEPQGDYIYYDANPRTDDPNSGRSLTKTSFSGNTTLRTSSGFEIELKNALTLQLKGKYDEAILSYSTILDKNVKTLHGPSILSRISACYEKSGKKDFIDYLNKSIRPKITKEDDLNVLTSELENHWLLKEGKNDEAMKNIKKMKSDYTEKAEIYKFALFREGYTYLEYLKDTVKAKEAFKELESKYPKDILVNDSKILLGEAPENFVEPLPDSDNDKLKKSQLNNGLPDKYQLLGNYPNPFNPSTTISYALPMHSSVEMKIYNIMGSEVRSFTINSQDAGYHSLQWDGRNSNNEPVSSGTYIYKLKAVSYENGQVFEKSAKMLLIK